MRYVTTTLREIRVAAAATYVLKLDGWQEMAEALPGQFVMLRGEWGADPLLPRAFSLLDVGSDGSIDLLIKAVGKATARLAGARPGDRFTVLGPLGSAFPTPDRARADWYVAGGVGLAPLYMQALRARRAEAGKAARFFYGGRAEADLALLSELSDLGIEVVLATEDGSRGHRGYVTQAVVAALEAHKAESSPTLLACGPEPMLQATAQLAHARGLQAFLSLEGEMACGLGACLACAVTCQTKSYRYACKDGPVFPLEELAGPYAPRAESGADRADSGRAP